MDELTIIADPHTHTIASGDAFSTLLENIVAAKSRGMHYLCVTDHAQAVLPNAPKPAYFKTLHALPRMHEGVYIIRGVEANVIDYDGLLDMPTDILDELEWVIASMHPTAIAPATPAEHTAGWLQIAENPSVDLIGHCDDPRYTFDVETVVKAFGRYGKVIEVNNLSPIIRKGSWEQGIIILQACKKFSVPVVLSSDAHFVHRVGTFETAISLVKEVDFPIELILNADEKKFDNFVRTKMQNV